MIAKDVITEPIIEFEKEIVQVRRMTLPSKSISKAFFANWKPIASNLSEGKVEINIDGEK